MVLVQPTVNGLDVSPVSTRTLQARQTEKGFAVESVAE